MRWTREEDEKLTSFSGKGMSLREIAKILHRPHGSVRARAEKIGVNLLRPTVPMEAQVFKLYNNYRLYITNDHYLITYHDREFVRISRTHQEHRPGFTLLVAQIIFEILRGTRTILRERWALWELEYEAEAATLDLKCKADDRKVLEFWFQKLKPKVKGEEEKEEIEE